MRICLIFCIAFSGFQCRENSGHSEPFGTVLGKVDLRLAEASGLVASINNPGFLWTLNDSGNPSEVFLIDQQAHIRLVVTLAQIENRDWEDIAIDQRIDGKSYLYVADIGDNYTNYECKLIYRFEEPQLSNEMEYLISIFDTLTLRMPDGKCDAETILIDPQTHELFMISKHGYEVSLYTAPQPLSLDTMMFEKILTLPYSQIVSGSISSDGQKVLLKNYTNIYYWEKFDGENLMSMFLRSPINLPYHREPQGEAIAWSRDGCAFFTLSESRWSEPASLIIHSADPIK